MVAPPRAVRGVVMGRLEAYSGCTGVALEAARTSLVERRPAVVLSAVVGGGMRFAAPSGATIFASLTSVAGATVAPGTARFES